jgi:hypothetical protein
LKVNLKIIFFVLISFIGISHSFAQTLGEIEKNADILFDTGEFVEAGKLYLKVISDRERIKDHTLNFKYGTCLLYNKGEKKQEAIAYLKRAVKKPSIDVRAHYYLGKAYHFNYQFDLAQKSYEKFQTQASTNEKKEFNVTADIKACKNGKKLLSDITDMIVIKKTQIKKDNFYELYKLENIGGSILRYDEFQSKYDKKVGHIPLIHFPKASPFIYFSSYGENGATGLDIYVVKKLPNNEWSLAQKIMGSVNTFQDEDFPYMSPDGRFLYFSSKGHNSMGGYDVFRSRYIAGDNSFMSPDNMDFAISSPDDDMFYMVDSLDRNAYFTSARESELGKLTVYHARVEKIPMQMAVIKGGFINTLDASNKDIEIVVSNYSNGKEIGKFNSNKKKGEYLITFPKSGKYTFIMTVAGEELSHQAVINIPYLKEFRPLKMSITHLTDAVNGNYIKVEQKFDEKFENPTAIMSEIFKELSKLKPNATKFDLDSLDRLGKVNEVFVDAGLDPYSTKPDVEKVVEDKIIDLEKIYDENDNNSTVAYHLADEKLKSSNETLEEIKLLVVEANNESDEVRKNEILQTVYSKNEKAKQQKIDASNYLELAQGIDNENNIIQNDIIKAKKLLLDVKSVDEEDRIALGNVIYNESAFFDEHVKKGTKITKSEAIIANGTVTIKEIAKINEELVKLNSEIKNLEVQNKNAKINNESTKKKKLKEKYLKTIADNENEIEMLTNEVKLNESQIDKLSKASGNIELTKLAQEVNDPAYDIKAYTTKIHPNDKAKIQNQLTESDSEYAKIDKVLDENNIKGQKVSLTGLNESRSDFTPAEWGEAIDEEIRAQERVMYQSTNPNEIDKIKGEIVRLNALKENKTNSGDSESALAARKNFLTDFESESIKLNEISNIDDREVAQNKLIKETLSKVESELVNLNAELAENPSNSEVSERIEKLNNLKTELSSRIVKNDVDFSGASTIVNVDKVYPSFSEEISRIENSNSTDKEKARGKLVLNNQLVSKINSEIESLTDYLATEPDNKNDIEERINNLKKMSSDKTEENLVLKAIVNKDDIAQGGGSDNVDSKFSNLETNVIATDLMPDYDSRQLSIVNSTVTEVIKSKEKIKLNIELTSKIEQEKNELITYLNTDPSNKKDVEKRIKNLETLKESLFIENSGYQSLIDSGNEGVNNSVVSVETINTDFERKQTQINSLENGNQKAVAQNKLNKETIDVIDTQISALESKLENDVTNEIIPNQIEELAQLKENLNSNIDTNIVDFSIITATVEIEDLLPRYYLEKESIADSKGSETVKATRNLALNDQLLSKIDVELGTLNNYLSSEPNNKKVVEKRIKNLEKLKSSVVKENVKYQTEIDTSDSIELGAEVVSIDKIISDFERKEEVNNAIENDNQKGLEQNKLIEETVILIEQQIVTLESNLEVDLENEVISNQIKDFSDLKIKLNGQVDANVIDYSKLSATVEIGELFPNYYTEKESITNSKGSETIKSTRNIALNDQLISKIDIEVAALNSYLNSEPTNQKDIEERLENLEKLKESITKENYDYQEVVKNNVGVGEIKDVVSIDVIMVDFERKQEVNNAIENVNEKGLAQNKLLEETVDLIERQVAVLESNFKTDLTNESIPGQIKEFTILKSKLNSQIDTNVIDYSSLSATIEVGDLLPNYFTEKESIANSKASEIVKASRNIELNNQLMSKVDSEIVALKSYLNSNVANKENIEKRLESLEKLKSSTTKENESYQIVIDSENKLLNGTISVGDLIPGFIEKIEIIENSDDSDSDKAVDKNKLNSDLIDKIDLKIIEFNTIKESDPSQLKVADSKIESLNKLKANTLKEIQINKDVIKSNGNNQVSISPKAAVVSNLSASDFSTQEGKEKIKDLETELKTLNEIKANLIELETEKENESSEKSVKNIDKKIKKNQIKQALIENQIIEELASINKNELSIKQLEVVNLKANSKSTDVIDDDILKAEEQLRGVTVKIERAKELRIEAGETNNPIEANEKYKSAIILENKAKAEMNEAIKVYKTAIVVNKISSTHSVITSVDENIENRQSTLLFNRVAEVEQEANYFEDRANILRDSAETVKKKYKDAILIDVQSNENKSNSLRIKAEEIKEKATLLKQQEDELLNLVPTNTLVTLQGEEKDKALESKAYKSYFETKSSADEDMIKAKSLESKIADLKSKTKRKIKMAVVVGGDINSITNDEDIKKLQAEINALTKEQETYKSRAIQKYSDANAVLNNTDLSDEVKTNIVALTIGKEQPKIKAKVTPSNSLLLADFTAPEKLNSEMFRTTDVPIYGSTKDIPVDTDQPTGLTYKVQIGAFRNEPDEKYFEKFAPVSGQSLDNGITRFMVGYFTNFKPANSVKTKIRGMGDYKDAFVVAYYNGERITIAEAKGLEVENSIPTTEYVEIIQKDNVIITAAVASAVIPNEVIPNEPISIENKENEPIASSNTNVTVIPTSDSDKEKASYYTNSPNAAKANQVEIMKGLFFTVQIGVYSKPVESSALFNTSPLNSQLTPTNKVRYTTGVFNSVPEASVRKSEVVDSGIPDAFVTAYYDGVRITITNAKQILKDNGPSILFLNQTPTEQSSIGNNENNVNYNKGNIYYRILIGKFEEEVPSKYAGFLFNTEGVIFETETDFDDNIFLLTTKQNSIGAVRAHLVELSELGIEDMQLVSYYNLDVINYEVGQRIVNNTQVSEYASLGEPEGVSADFLLYKPEAIFYQVVIAEFENDVPVDMATVILELDPDTYEEATNDFGYVTYNSIKFESFEIAQSELNNYKAKGFSKARVIAIHKYQEISVDKAIAIKGK